MNWENVYVFISSTFNDMHAERDYLLKYVFPELREWCTQRKINLIDIDLRWGITEEDAKENKKVVDICLKNVDKARPIFLCFLGQRRGWVPNVNDLSPDTLINFPKINSEIGKRSITELEIMHACCSSFASEKTVDCCPFFFLRDPSYLAEINNQIIKEQVFTNKNKKDDLEQKIFWEMISKKIPADHHYIYSAKWSSEMYSPEVAIADIVNKEMSECKTGRLCDFVVGKRSLKDVIISELKKEIESIYSENLDNYSNALDDGINTHEAFFRWMLQQYIERDSDNLFLDNYIFSDNPELPIYIVSPHGMGKTSYISKCIERYSSLPDSVVLYRFIGIDHKITNEESLLNNILEELVAKGLLNKNSVPKDPLVRCEKFYELLDEIESKLNKLIVFIDGIDQFEIGIEKLKYIPRDKSKLKLVVSCATEALNESFVNKIKKGVQIVSIHKFDNDLDKINLSTAFFANYLKTPDKNMLLKIISQKGSSNPLYLKILLSELRLYGSFETLNDKIDSKYGETPLTAFSEVINRLISDPAYLSVENYQAVKCALGVLACSRTGLTQEEYVFAVNLALGNSDFSNTSLASEVVFYFYRQLQDYIIFKNGIFSIRYESFKKAILKYFSESVCFFHKCLAISMLYNIRMFNCTAMMNVPVNSFTNLPFHLFSGNSKGILLDLLNDFNFILQKTKYCGSYRMLADFDYVKTNQASFLSEALMRTAQKFENPEYNCKNENFEADFALYFLGHISPKNYTYLDSIKTDFSFIKTAANFFDNEFVWKRCFDGTICHISCLDGRVNLVSATQTGKIIFYQFDTKSGETLNHFKIQSNDMVFNYLVGNPIYSKSLKREISSGILCKVEYGGKKYVYPATMIVTYNTLTGFSRACSLPATINTNFAFISINNTLKKYNFNGQLISSYSYQFNIDEIIATDRYMIIRSDNKNTTSSVYRLLDLERNSFSPIDSIESSKGRLHLVNNSFVLDFETRPRQMNKIIISNGHLNFEPIESFDFIEKFKTTQESSFYTISNDGILFQTFDSYIISYEVFDAEMSDVKSEISVFEDGNQLKAIEFLSPFRIVGTMNMQQTEKNTIVFDFDKKLNSRICSNAQKFENKVFYLSSSCLVCVSDDGDSKGRQAIINIPSQINCDRIAIISNLIFLFTKHSAYYVSIESLDIKFEKKLEILNPEESVFYKINLTESISNVFCSTKNFLLCGTETKNRFGFMRVKDSKPTYSEFSFSDKFQIETVSLCNDNLILFMNSRVFTYQIDVEKLRIISKKETIILNHVKKFICSYTNEDKVYVLSSVYPEKYDGDLFSVDEISIGYDGTPSVKKIVSIDKPVESIMVKNNVLITVFCDGTFSTATI